MLRHESKCASLHGHRYVAEIGVRAEALDEVDRVVDFGVVKTKVGGWIDAHWDHTTLVNEEDHALRQFTEDDAAQRGKRPPYVLAGEPTAENIAAELFHVASKLLNDDRIRVVSVRVHETPNCSALYAPD